MNSSTLRILHLEDNARDAELVKEMLLQNELECAITRVQNRADFENEIAQGNFDLIISDYRLPSFDGISALGIAHEKCPEIPFIFVSGNIGEESAIETLKNGATDYILKDRLLRLVASVKRAIREVEMRKEHKQLEEKFRQSQKMEAIGRLAGGIAHDFNNLLTVISGYSEVLMREYEKIPEVYQGLQEIRKAAEKSSALTYQLLAFSRRQMLRPKVLDLNGVIANSNQMLHRLVGEDIEHETSLDPNLGRIKVDPNQLEQVILNLVVNARDAMPGGGKITIQTTNTSLERLQGSYHQDVKAGEYVLLSVKDTGSGMTEEVKQHIFEPFFTTKGEGKGTGLGLATVFGVVRQSGGYVEVESEADKGTLFKIYFPRVEELCSPDEVKHAPTKQKGSETILLVEDEEAVRLLTRRILEAFGYRVLEAESGYKALATCGSYKDKIHMLLTDSIMPKMSGEELSKQIIKKFPDIKVLYISGYTNLFWNKEPAPKPNIGFLQKPFTPSTLGLKVREMLDQQV